MCLCVNLCISSIYQTQQNLCVTTYDSQEFIEGTAIVTEEEQQSTETRLNDNNKTIII